ncbi:MAG: O-antigen ligase family protein [bacterium]
MIKLNLENIYAAVLGLAIFCLPLGTVFILRSGEINNTAWPLYSIVLYLSEIVCLVVVASKWQVIQRQFSSKWWKIFGALALLNILISVSPLASLGLWLHVALALAFGLAVALENDSKPLVKYWLLGALLVGALAGFQVYGNWQGANKLLGISSHELAAKTTSVVEVAGERVARGYAAFPHPNILAGYAVLVTLLLLLEIETVALRRWRLFIYGGLLAIGQILGLSFSRAGILIFGVIVDWSFIKRPKARLGAAVALAGLFVALLFFPEAYLTRLQGSGRLETISNAERVSSVSRTLPLIGSNLLFGVGFGGSSLATSFSDPGRPAWDYEPPHSLPILIILEFGFVGLALLGWFVTSKGELWARGSYGRQFCLLALIGLGLFDHYLLTSPQFMLIGGAFLGTVHVLTKPHGKPS